MAVASLVVALILAAAVAGLWRQLQGLRRTGDEHLLSHASFEQSPRASVMLDETTLDVIAANAAFLRESGYSLDEIQGLNATQLFVDETSEDALTVQLRAASGHAALKTRQRRKDGKLVDVDLVGHRVQCQ